MNLEPHSVQPAGSRPKAPLWAAVYFLPSCLTHLAESRGAALGDLCLQHANEAAELDAVVELLHEELGPDLLIWSRDTC